MFSRIIISLALVFGFVSPVMAAEEKILTQVEYDWNQDGIKDKAVLIEVGDKAKEANLSIHLSDPKTKSLKVKVESEDIAWVGTMDGTKPSLSINPKGSLLIHSGNESFGRNRWKKTLTVAYRDNEFVVGGFTYNSMDTMEPSLGIDCDFNFFTSKGIKNGKPFQLKAKPVMLQLWSSAYVPKKCFEK